MEGLIALNRAQALIVEAVFERLFPADETGPGATEIGALTYLDRALAGAYANRMETYRIGLRALDAAARAMHGTGFAACSTEQQDDLIRRLEQGELTGWDGDDQRAFFGLLLSHCQEGLFADPIYGGNRDKSGWRWLRHTGVWLENSADEQLQTEPVTKGGIIKSLADLGAEIGGVREPEPIPGFDPHRGAAPPSGRVDVVIVGVGAVGGYIAPILTAAGLKVVGLEAGPYRTPADFVPDELGATYYCRQNMGEKFLSEEIRWRESDDAPTKDPTYSLGRMMNSVGGSVIHYGGWLRRYHPHHFRTRSWVKERWGEDVLPEGCTLADWPTSYEELEPYFSKVEYDIGIAASDDGNPFVERSRPFPMPPLRPFRMGNIFSESCRSLGLHPHPVPVGVNSVPYNGLPATRYSAWSNGFGCWDGSKWHPGLTSVPQALATGNFDLRTHCRVTRVLTNGDGRATGVEYIDARGERRVQEADVVILASYTWENMRLLALSADDKHPDGLGNTAGQLGKHVMIKTFPHVDGYVPDVVFNRHAGPAYQAIVLDDFVQADFDCWGEGGFVGGSTIGAENQFLPIQISRESLPPEVPRWGSEYKRHIRDWQHFAVVRYQPETLPYVGNEVDIDPRARDRSGIGMPVVRLTYRMRDNEIRQAKFFCRKGDAILRGMGATKTWEGPIFTGVGSSHDLGGTRMSADPSAGVLDRSLRVHDTPGLYVFSGTAFPSCPGVNPTLTLWALAALAADRLIERFRDGKDL